MDPSGYRVFYDVSQVSPAWWLPGLGLPFVLLGALFWRFRHAVPLPSDPTFGRLNPMQHAWFRTAFAGFFLGFSILWTTLASVGMFGWFFHAKALLEKNEVPVVEGPVEDFHLESGRKRERESFVVRGVRFAYQFEDDRVHPGFSRTHSFGGPIRPGLMVRIHYMDSTQGPVILKLEVKDQ